MSNYAAQNLGAGKTDRISQGFRAGLKLVWMLCIPLSLLYFFVGKPLLLLFMNEPSKEAVDSGIILLRIIAPFYFVVSAKLIADGVLRGTSMMGKFMIATFTDLILRVILAIVLSKTAFGYTCIWCAWPIGWSIAAILSVSFYRGRKYTAWPKKKHQSPNDDG